MAEKTVFDKIKKVTQNVSLAILDQSLSLATLDQTRQQIELESSSNPLKTREIL